MKEISLQIPIKPLSINQKFSLHSKRRMFIKSAKAVNYERELNTYLKPFDDLLRGIGLNYIKTKHSFSFDVEIFVPQHEFFTKRGTINEKCIDVTNAFKILEDALFKRIGVDDSQITQASISKSPWPRETWSCIIRIKLINAPKSSYLDQDI